MVLFRQADLTRALKGVAAAGLRVSKVDIDVDGNISIVIGGKAVAGVNDWDEVLEPNWRDASPLYHPELAKPKRKPRKYGD